MRQCTFDGEPGLGSASIEIKQQESQEFFAIGSIHGGRRSYTQDEKCKVDDNQKTRPLMMDWRALWMSTRADEEERGEYAASRLDMRNVNQGESVRCHATASAHFVATANSSLNSGYPCSSASFRYARYAYAH